MNEIHVIMFLAGLSGSVGHCFAMCGPVVASCSFVAGNRGILPHMLYNAGRISSYALLGGIAGLAGSYASILGGDPAGEIPFGHATLILQKSALAISGLVIVLMGLGMSGAIPLVKKIEQWGVQSPLILRSLKYLGDENSVGVFFPIGLVLGFIPCGMVYASVLASARAAMELEGHAAGMLEGASLMALFGLGTAFPLMVFGKVSNVAGVRMRRRFRKVSSALVVIMGVLFIYKAFR